MHARSSLLCICMLLPLEWDYSTPVMYPLLSKRGWFFAWNTAIIAGCLLVFQYAFLKALSTHSAVLGHLLDVVIHSCNYIHLHLVQQPCRLFMKNDCLVWDDRKLVTTLCVIIQTATSLLVMAILSLPSGLVHEVPSTEFSNHPSIIIAAWRYVV